MLVDLSTTIEKATIAENKKCGIYMSAKAKKNVSISKSKISGNQAYGVFVGGNNTLTVKNTTVEKSKLSGIEGNSGIIKVTGKASCIQNNGKYGICIRKPGRLYISGGKIANNKNCGVVYYGSTGYCKNADIRGNLTGVMVAAGARLSDLSGNTFTDNKSYGAAVYLNPSGATTTVQKCKKNTFHDPKATMELMYWSGTSVPSSLNRMAPVSIDNQVKAKKSLVNGTATPGGSITVSVSGKKYRAQNVTNAGTFAVKVKALKKGNRVTVTYTDKNQNKIIAEKAL